MKQLVFLIISSTPSLKSIAQISNHSIWLNRIIFIVFYISTIVRDGYQIQINVVATPLTFKYLVHHQSEDFCAC